MERNIKGKMSGSKSKIEALRSRNIPVSAIACGSGEMTVAGRNIGMAF
jgi:hypothetical protein